jgi:hypothetical protein
VRVARDLGLHPGAAEVLHGDLLAEHRLDHLRTGDEHLADLVDHEDEIGQGRTIDRTAGTGAEDHRDLRDHARGQGVAVEDLPVAGQRVDAFLDPRAARVVDPDQGDAHLHGMVHDLGDLARVRQAQGTAGDGEVLGEDADREPLHHARPGDHPVARQPLAVHAEVAATVLDEEVVLVERVGIADHIHPVSRRELALGDLLLDRLLTATLHQRAGPLEEIVDPLAERHAVALPQIELD